MKRETRHNALIVVMLLGGAFLSAVAKGSDAAVVEAGDGGGCVRTLSVRQLLAAKLRYDKKRVCVRGILHIEFEGDELRGGAAAIWLSFWHGPPYTDAGIARDRARRAAWQRKYQDTCVVVEGVLDASDRGHLGMWQAGLRGIEHVVKSREACTP